MPALYVCSGSLIPVVIGKFDQIAIGVMDIDRKNRPLGAGPAHRAFKDRHSFSPQFTDSFFDGGFDNKAEIGGTCCHMLSLGFKLMVELVQIDLL